MTPPSPKDLERAAEVMQAVLLDTKPPEYCLAQALADERERAAKVLDAVADRFDRLTDTAPPEDGLIVYGALYDLACLTRNLAAAIRDADDDPTTDCHSISKEPA